eukprot:9854310-Alexandrium_andersonii.AAC.1
MSASLVGSEMCIRDSDQTGQGSAGAPRPTYPSTRPPQRGGSQPPEAVSYTHLTLPTICSV